MIHIPTLFSICRHKHEIVKKIHIFTRLIVTGKEEENIASHKLSSKSHWLYDEDGA